MNQQISTELNLRELTIEEIDMVSGADRGDATVAGAIAGGMAGARVGGFYGAVVGGVVGAGVAYFTYNTAMI